MQIEFVRKKTASKILKILLGVQPHALQGQLSYQKLFAGWECDEACDVRHRGESRT